MLRLNQIMYCRTCCHDAFREVVDAEAFQRDRMEVLVENLVGIVVGENPVVENSEVIFCAEQVNEVLPLIALHQHLRWIEALQQLVNVFVGALGKEKLARGNIEERHT